MFLIRSLDKISTFYIQDSFIVFDQDGNLKRYQQNLKSSWVVDPSTQHLCLTNDKWVFPYTQYKKINIENGEIVNQIQGDIYPITLQQNDLFCEYFIENTLYLSRIIVENFKVIKITDISNQRVLHIFDLKKFITYHKATFYIYDLDVSEKPNLLNIDYFSASLNAKVGSNPIIIDHRLFFYVYDPKKKDQKSTICIDYKSKTVDRILFNFTGSIKESDGLLYNSHEKSLQILDPETFKVEEIDLLPELTKHGFKRIDYEKWFVEDRHLYFAQNIGDNIAKVGIYDLESKTIIDKLDLAKENGTVGTLKKNGNRLYIHTQDRTLHIYELEGLES
jgi:hypothetical protein